VRLLGDISRLNARRFANETALFFEEDQLTFEELDRGADAVGRQLQDSGIAPGDRVAILAENCLEYIPIYFGIVKIGAICVPLNYRCVLEELEHMLRDSGVRIVFFTPSCIEQATGLASRLAGRMQLVEMGRHLLLPTSRPLDPLSTALDENAPAAILYTSGTTGTPKGAVLPHRSLIEGSAGIALVSGIRHSDRALVTVPLFHGGGLYVLAHSHLYVGASLVIERKFVASEQLKLISQYGVTTFFGVAAQYAMLLDELKPDDVVPSHLCRGWYGAAPMPVDLVKRSQAVLPGVRFQQLYGQTETTVVSVLSIEDHDRKMGSAGRELANVQMRVVDEEGVDCGPGAVGEIIVHENSGMRGYFNNPEQTAETIRDGWIYTGDLGFLDEERFITIVDRKRDVILSGGENIYPKEIEDVLSAHPSVLDVAVVGTIDSKWGEIPVAFVMLRPLTEITTEVLHSWCEARLARYKIPKCWHFITELPRTSTGKVQKQHLRDLARQPK
jgi:acyl-CoA synthetase (AMP-forming)/AMP-acid ligase II